jgi:hypothetical protein
MQQFLGNVRFTTVSSSEFNQDTNRATKIARNGPVFVPDRGNPAQAFLIGIEDDRKLPGSCLNIVQLPGIAAAYAARYAEESRTLASTRPD